MILEYIK